jgi:tetratricopeptide (TPR) repeat protein
MNTEWNILDDYFANRLAPTDRARFEENLRTDTALAEAVAFYLSAKRIVRQEAQSERRSELLARTPRLTRYYPWPYAVAAAACLVLLLGIGWVLWFQQQQPAELADQYINQHFSQLSVTMGADSDSLQRGLDLANEGKLAEADGLLSQLVTRQPANADALKWAGVVALRRGQYDAAIDRFSRLSQRTDLYANPGLFYEALALLKRNGPDDKARAKELLEAVVARKLDGSSEASRLLRYF